jgi:hypothetical protein
VVWAGADREGEMIAATQEEFLSPEKYHTGAGHYKIPVSHAWAKKYGIPRIQIELLWKRGKITSVLLFFRQSKQWDGKGMKFACTADSFLVSGNSDYSLMGGWCKDHKTQFLTMCVERKDITLYIGSGIHIYLDGFGED